MDQERRPDVGAVIIGLIFLGVGGWFLLENTFGIDLPTLNWDMIWPLFIIAIGVGIVWRAWERGHARG
jgi:TRAP-type C4-dicarboxylate transport system permease small subunit